MKLISTTTSDNLRLTGILEESQNSENIIIHFHGMAGDIYSNSFYPDMYDQYPKNGWSILGVEHRGTHTINQYKKGNEYINIGNAYEIFEESIFDIESWIQKAVEIGYKNIWLQSHSLAPSKVAYYMYQKKPTNISGLIWLSPGDMIGLVHDPEGQKDHDLLYPEALQLVKQGKGTQLLQNKLWGSNILSAQTYVNLFADDANTNIFNYADPAHSWKVVNSISVPVLAITGTEDDAVVPVMEPHKAMEKLENQLTRAPKKKTIVYEGANHDFEGFGNQIVADVLEFINP